MHSGRGMWWSRTAEQLPLALNQSCTGALYVCLPAYSACLPAGPSVSCWLCIGKRKEILTSPSWLTFWKPTVNIPLHSSIAIWSILPPTRFIVSLCFQKDTISFCTGAHNAMNCLNHSGLEVFTDAHPNNWKADSFDYVYRWKPNLWFVYV